MNERNQNLLLWAAAGLGAALAVRALVRQSRAYDLRGKTVLVTGGARGLGLVLARELIREGARIAICARDEAELERARLDLVGRGGDVLAVPCDVTEQAQVNRMVDQVATHFGPIDVLINNAGIIDVGPVEVMTLADYDRAMKTHFWAPLYTMLAVLPEMRRRKAGRIVNISSIGGKVSVPHLVPYNASKFALTGLSEGLRAELANDQVYVTTVCPGLMRTGSPLNASFKSQHRAEFAWFSISDAIPGVSMNAERAARQILDACKCGDAEVVLSVPAKVAVWLHGLFPGLTADLLGWVNRLLPEPGGIGSQSLTGRESTSALSPSWVTALSDKAAAQNNELSATEHPARTAVPG
jgi:NAD(P)-dependent dehydrogenase (short-subunit alcohol dehydrogenase family)